MHEEESLRELQKKWHGSLKLYVVGFITCLILTFAAFLLVATGYFSGTGLIFTIVGLGIVQATVQLLFFLHVGQEAKPHWETMMFLLMVLILVIIVIGSLWIMYDLDNRMMIH